MAIHSYARTFVTRLKRSEELIVLQSSHFHIGFLGLVVSNHIFYPYCSVFVALVFFFRSNAGSFHGLPLKFMVSLPDREVFGCPSQGKAGQSQPFLVESWRLGVKEPHFP